MYSILWRVVLLLLIIINKHRVCIIYMPGFVCISIYMYTLTIWDQPTAWSQIAILVKCWSTNIWLTFSQFTKMLDISLSTNIWPRYELLTNLYVGQRLWVRTFNILQKFWSEWYWSIPIMPLGTFMSSPGYQTKKLNVLHFHYLKCSIFYPASLSSHCPITASFKSN